MLGRTAPLLILTLALSLACVPVGTSAPSIESQQPVGPKRITGAVLGDVKSIAPDAVQSARPIRGLLQAGLANLDDRGQLRAQLAESLPSLENDLWKVFPDGRMETVWKIAPGARWHDGTEVTSSDVLFTAQVAQDRELPAFRNPSYQLVESIEAIDAKTIVVTWRNLYIDANQLFPGLLPMHVLVDAARTDKANFVQLPYWSVEFVGTGAFKLKEWVPGTSILLQANEAYPLGRPKLDEMEVKIVTNPSTFVTNLLAGVVDVSLGLTLSTDQALEVKDSWTLGRVEIVPRPGWIVIWPQLAYSNPAVVADVQFRRALLHATDRQELVDTLVAGFSTVAHSILPAGRSDLTHVRQRAPIYEYDSRKAEQMIAGLGYVRAADGVFVNAAGQRLAIEMRTTTEAKALFSVADYWKRVGVAVEADFTPPQMSDPEFQATYPGFKVNRHTADETWLVNFTSSNAPTRENRWTGNNNSGYRSEEYDALYDRYTKTIPMAERIELIGELAYRLANEAVGMGLYYDSLVAFVGNRVGTFTVPQSYGTPFTWSAHLWDVRT
jgi:peptide/nickel transport system substrate-binding protein